MPSISARSDDLTGPDVTAPAVWYDGANALRHEGQARWHAPGSLRLSEVGAVEVEVPLADLQFGEAVANEQIFTRASIPGFRLRLPRDLPPDFAQLLPAQVTYGRWIDRLGLGRAATALAIVSASVVALFMAAPQWLGPMIPLSWERRIGDAMIGDLGNRLCSTPESNAALAKLTSAINAGGPPIQVGIANVDMVNAVALPGSQVLLFDGLVQQAQSPEELAGVLAHEIGHVRQRHVMSALLRQVGLTVLLSGANSEAAGSIFGLASLSYSRSAEQEADAAARQLLARADISPLGAAAFFDRMSIEDGEAARETVPSKVEEGDKQEGEAEGITTWLASHAASRQRAAEYRAAARPRHEYRSPLSAPEFAALRRACAEDKDVVKFDFL